MTLGNLDFDTYAKAYGIEGSTVKGPDDLRRRSKPLSRRVASMSPPCQWITRRTCGSWWTSCGRKLTHDAMAGAQVVIDLANSPSSEDKAVLEFFETSDRNLLAA